MKHLWLLGPLALCASAPAATVTFDLVPLTPLTGNEVVVSPGQQVEFQLVATVVSDTEVADNHGLELFDVNILTGSGVAQQSMDVFSPEIAQNFPIGASLGTPEGDQILNVGASQLGLGTPFFEGIGVGQAAILATGRLNTPTVETTFTPRVDDNPAAFVVGGGSQDLQAVPANSVVGPGFTIRTSNTTTGDDGQGDGSGDGTDGTAGGTDDSGGTSSPDSTTATQSPTGEAVAIAAAALIALIAAFWSFGPLGLAVGLIVVPLLGILLLIMGG